MLYTAAAFLLLALVTGLLGFPALAGTATSIAQVLVLVFLVFFLDGVLAARRVRA